MKPSCSRALVRPTMQVKENSANTGHKENNKTNQQLPPITHGHVFLTVYRKTEGPCSACFARWEGGGGERSPGWPFPFPGWGEVCGVVEKNNLRRGDWTLIAASLLLKAFRLWEHVLFRNVFNNSLQAAAVVLICARDVLLFKKKKNSKSKQRWINLLLKLKRILHFL